MNCFRRPHVLASLAALFALAVVAPAQNKDTDPVKDQVLRLYKDFKGRDWKDIYNIIGLSAKAGSMGTPEEFAAGFDQGIKSSDPNNAFGKLIDSMTDISVGYVLIEGDFAYVPTICTITIDATTVKLMGIAKMKKINGTWKWDLTSVDDPEQAAAERTAQLFGEPPKDLGN